VLGPPLCANTVVPVPLPLLPELYVGNFETCKAFYSGTIHTYIATVVSVLPTRELQYTYRWNELIGGALNK
jgi:hypothetical protein